MINIIIAVLELLLGVGFIGFWLYFFAVENRNAEQSEIYLSFERSFPVPDLGWITPCLFIAGIGILMEQSYGVFFTIISGSALVFLGLLDISFNIQNEGYTKSIADTVMNLSINLICIILGPLFLIYAYRIFVNM